jgi:chromosome segregation ATPase
MRLTGAALILLLSLFFPSWSAAIEQAPQLTDREVVERLTRLEEGLQANVKVVEQLRQEVAMLREETNTRFDRLREDINKQFDRIDAQFDRIVNVMLGIMGAFVALVGITIGLMLWDRRTMIRPFEEKTRKLEDELSLNRTALHSLLEALRALSQRDEKVAEVLKKFNLL